MTCDLCCSREYSQILNAKDYITGSSYNVVECRNCGLAFVNPQPSTDVLDECYPPTYYGKSPFLYEKLDAFFRFKKTKNLTPYGGTVLDIGSGRGLVLDKFRGLGCEVYGTELSSVSARYAQEELGLNILDKNLEECRFTDNSFDVITMFHSLEHLTSPHQTLVEIHRILKPDGVLVVEVPDFGSIYSKIFQSRWFHLDVPRHLFHFRAETLENLLITSSFTVFKKNRHALMYDSFGALQSLLNCLCSKQNLLNDLNTKRTNWQTILKSGQKRLILDAFVSVIGQVFLYLPLFVVVFFLSLFNVGGTLTFYARPQK